MQIAALNQSAFRPSKRIKEPKMSVWNGWRVVTLCLAVIGTIATGRAQTAGSKQINAALTFNGDEAQRMCGLGFHLLLATEESV